MPDTSSADSSATASEQALPAGDPELLLHRKLTPMDAVNALYSEDNEELSEAIIASLSRQIFDADLPATASGIKRRLAGLVHRLLKRTTRPSIRKDADGNEVTVYRNSIVERSRHPYAMTLLEPSMADSASFVEGGDPMNAPYMMISPEISRNGSLWDRIFLDSVQAKDVQLRFVLETKFTYEVAKKRLDRGEPVRLKAAAAGTGLSKILVFDRLIREGADSELITAIISDQDAANVAKTNRLLGKLATTRKHIAKDGKGPGILSRTKDLLHPVANAEADPPYDLVTLVGILEYFRGYTCSSTEEHHDGQAISEEGADAVEIIRKIADITAESGYLIANTYRVEIAARILEIFGKRLYFRNREDLQALVATAGYVSTGIFASGNVYDVEVFEKKSDPTGES